MADIPETPDCTTRSSRCFIAVLLLLGIAYLYYSSIITAHPPQTHYGKPVCNLSMFQSDSNAYLSCRALDALQNNWFPSPIAGLFTYQAWNGFDGFWQNGVVLETLANFMDYTNSTRYRKTLLSSLRSLSDLTNAYAPEPSCDDEMWYGLAYVRIYEVTGERSFLTTAEEIYNWAWTTCWDTSMQCHGGLYFDSSHGFKSTITNVQGLTLAPWLYTYTQNPKYLQHAYALLDYIMLNNIINQTTFIVYDSIDLGNCKPGGGLYTYESGMALAAMLRMYKLTGQNNYTQLSHKIAEAAIKYYSNNGILTEGCDSNNCKDSKDARSFKGIFVRNIRYLMDVSSTSQRKTYQNWLQQNINSLLHNASCDTTHSATTGQTNNCSMIFQDGAPLNTPTGPVFNENWSGPFEYSTPIEQTSALTLLVAAILPNTQCIGQECNYDPDVPDVTHLTCDPDPCPVHYTCCSWDQSYHTCCTPGQQCVHGGCY